MDMDMDMDMGHRSLARRRLTFALQLGLCLAHALQVTANDLALHGREVIVLEQRV